jgi:hypothetical protein
VATQHPKHAQKPKILVNINNNKLEFVIHTIQLFMLPLTNLQSHLRHPDIYHQYKFKKWDKLGVYKLNNKGNEQQVVMWWRIKKNKNKNKNYSWPLKLTSLLQRYLKASIFDIWSLQNYHLLLLTPKKKKKKIDDEPFITILKMNKNVKVLFLMFYMLKIISWKFKFLSNFNISTLPLFFQLLFVPHWKVMSFLCAL